MRPRKPADIVTSGDTICAIATGAGAAGVGVVRVSGPDSLKIARHVLGFEPTPRHAHFANYLGDQGQRFESGIALFFQSPNSFTGEDILELQGHGGQQILQLVIARCLQLGARLAEPGEFSERAFLNGKLDLTQAEAIADLIEAGTEQAARAAIRSLQGDFANAVNTLREQIIDLRREIEASIDFSDEEIEFQSREKTIADIQRCQESLATLLKQARQGALLGSGIKVAIAGKPNAGKSSLLNALAGLDRAIVTDIPGTTRDLLNEQLSIDGLPVQLVDTAGLRKSIDPVEIEGVKRAGIAMADSDRILLLIDGSLLADSSDKNELKSLVVELLAETATAPDKQELIKRCSVLVNKIDLIHSEPELSSFQVGKVNIPVINLAAKTGQGLDLLRQHLHHIADYTTSSQSTFSARQRHIDALVSCHEYLNNAAERVSDYSHWDLMAEDLRIAQQQLNKITGEFTTDDLLGEIFSNFCVGK